MLSVIMRCFAGRMGRLAFLGWNILGALAFGTLLLDGMLWRQSGGGIAAIGFLAIAYGGWLCLSTVVTVRRLHDFGRSGVHGVWIVLFGNGGALATDASPELSTILVILRVAVCLRLLLQRGDVGPNAYGPAPGNPSPMEEAAV